ncbi:ABC transporter substrate-binding protein [Desulfovibrio sp. JC022]|uniref:substrate-binding periplasmic protein n=1 Tax=Desulfovibrio sp. JC022 TaxID=2593642 RepID=UPI0013CF8617|nr:transporter substrate-binding domain-containing protein [Desulfovibrio sp. JC022]NDV21884.1 amino acid ABC transporter substrate-binding protein [Desulfovibrio sp. JC022]
MKQLAICFVAVLFLAGVVFVNVSAAETLRVMLHEGSFPPYYFKEGDVRTGIVKDIFNAFGQETGDTFEFVRCPFNRSQRKFDAGELDIEPMSNPVWRQSAKVLGEFSKPFAVSDSIVLFRADKVIPDVAPKDLLGKTVGVVRGYYYPVYSPYFADGRINSHILENENKLVQLLLADRLDQALMNKDFAFYQIKEQGLNGKLAVSKPYDSLEMMIRFHPSKKDAIPRFNKAIDKLLNDGTIKKIYDQYR